MTDGERNFRFERIYNRLFGNIVENHGRANEKWRYDPLVPNYPTIDGILRRKTICEADIGDKHTEEREEFFLVQLKGTELGYPELRDLLNRAGEKVNQIARLFPTLLIGMLVKTTRGDEQIKEAYIHAPSDDLAEAKISQNDAIEPSELANKIACVMDARARRRDLDIQHRKGLTLLPEQEDTLYFNKGLHGWRTVKEGIVSGRDISINWTLPRFTKKVTIKQIEGRASIEAVPVELPRPPYKEIPGNRKPITESWEPLEKLQDGRKTRWVIQIHFKEEAAVGLEAHL